MTTKGRYALRAMLELAKRPEGELVPLRQISEAESIPHDFLEQLMIRMRHAGLLRAVRGPSGGYALAKPVSAISVLEILDASGEELSMSPCSCIMGDEAECPHKEDCGARSLWSSTARMLRDYFSSLSLSDLLASAHSSKAKA